MADPTTLPPGFVLDPQPAPSLTPVLAKTPPPQTPAQASKDVSEAQTAAEVAKQNAYKVTEEQLATQKQQAQKDMNTEGLNELISSVERAKGLVNGWSTGAAGAALSSLPMPTDAGKLDAIIGQEIRGNIFLNRVNQMKQENPSTNGGTGIGRIMQAEIPMITGALGTLNPTKLGEQGTMDSLNQIEYRALRSKAILDGKDPDDPAIQKQYGIDKIAALLPSASTHIVGGSGGDGGSGGGNTPPGVSSLNPDQQKAYNAFLQANPNPTGDQVGTFLTHLTGQQVTNGDDIAKAISQGRGVSSTVQNKTEQRNVNTEINNEDKAGIDQENPAARVLIHGATLGLSDEASGAGRAVANVLTSPFTGNFDPVGAYRLGRDVEQQRVDNAEKQLGVGAAPLEFVGSLASANPEGAVGSAADTIRNLVLRGAKAGGAYGAISGFGYGRGLGQSAVGAGVGGITGAGIGALGGRFLGGKTPPPDVPGTAAPADIANALQTEGIPAARPVADPAVRGKMAYLETTRGGHGPVQDSLALTRQSIADKVAGLSGNGEALTPDAMGETIQNAGNRAINSMKSQATNLYNQASNAAGDTPVAPKEALNVLDQNLAELQRNPNSNAGIIGYLQDVRNDLTNGTKTVADLRNIRTGISGEINRRNLGQTNAERIMGNVMDAAGQDVSRDLGQSNPQALSLYQQGDDLWRQMSTERDQVLSKLIGPDASNPISGEQASARVQAMMGNKGDLGRFKRVMNMMDPDEQANFQATLFDGLGRRSPDEPFSPGVFVQQTRNLRPDAIRSAFGDDVASSIQNLRVAARGLQDTQNSLNNSRSGFVTNFKNVVGTLLNLKSVGLGGAGYAVGGVPGMVAGASIGPAIENVANRLSAKALMNPDVSQWIRKVATAKTDQQARALIGKLNGLAASSGGIQGEIGGFRDTILKAMNDNATTSAAASGPNNSQGNQN